MTLVGVGASGGGASPAYFDDADDIVDVVDGAGDVAFVVCDVPCNVGGCELPVWLSSTLPPVVDVSCV